MKKRLEVITFIGGESVTLIYEPVAWNNGVVVLYRLVAKRTSVEEPV